MEGAVAACRASACGTQVSMDRSTCGICLVIRLVWCLGQEQRDDSPQTHRQRMIGRNFSPCETEQQATSSTRYDWRGLASTALCTISFRTCWQPRTLSRRTYCGFMPVASLPSMTALCVDAVRPSRCGTRTGQVCAHETSLQHVAPGGGP